MAVTALQAAKHACEVSGWTLTNLKLQKLLYLAHMIYSGKNHRPLIDDECFQAWNYGPVLPNVYRRGSTFGAGPIKNIFHSVSDIADGDEATMISDVVKKFAPIPAFKLVELTHDHKGAWARCFSDGARSVDIPQSAIVEEYARRFPEIADQGD